MAWRAGGPAIRAVTGQGGRHADTGGISGWPRSTGRRGLAKVLRVMLDVPRELVLFVSGLLAARRREVGTRKGTRRLGCYRQALFALAWFRDKGDLPRLGRGFGLPQSTAYRYLDEAITVLAARAPGLQEAPERAVAWAASVPALASAIPTVEAAFPVLILIYFPVLIVSGLLGSISEPHWLTTLASYLPVRPLADAVTSALRHASGTLLFPAHDLLTLAVWAAAGLAAAITTFRWEPHRPAQRRAARATPARDEPGAPTARSALATQPQENSQSAMR
jgi:hypothetical protein